MTLKWKWEIDYAFNPNDDVSKMFSLNFLTSLLSFHFQETGNSLGHESGRELSELCRTHL